MTSTWSHTFWTVLSNVLITVGSGWLVTGWAWANPVEDEEA